MSLKGSILILCLSLCYTSPIYVEPVKVASLRIAKIWLAQKGDVPYQAALKTSLPNRPQYMTYCGAVIVAPSKLLTVAHCIMTERNLAKKYQFSENGLMNVPNSALSNIYAVANNLNLFDNFSNIDSVEHGQWRSLDSALVPANFKFPNSDIAALFTSKPFEFDNYVNAIPVASNHVEYVGTCLASSYGRLSRQDMGTSLICAHLNIIPTPLCNKLHRRNMVSFVCTTSRLSDVGKGDSGGPLVCSNTGDPNEKAEGILVGLISGHRPRSGSFFTRVSTYNDILATSSSNLMHVCNVQLVFVCLIMILIHGTFCLF